MRPTIRTLVLAPALALVLATPAGAAPASDTDVRGPACADITDGAGVFDGSDVNFRLTLAAPSCRSVTYNLVVLDEDGDTTPIATATASGDGSSNQVFFTDVAASDPDGTVCVYATTRVGNHVFDRAPDEGCMELTVDGPPSGQKFR